MPVIKTRIIPFILAFFIASACGETNLQNYELVPVIRGTIERTVFSSGTLQPVSAVRVLSQISGKVEKIFADYNDTVRRGDLLAELNTDVLRLRREEQYAAVQIARANHRLQEINYNNQIILAGRNLISEFDLLTGLTNLENLKGILTMAEANLALLDAEINRYAYITSPIDGIILDKRISEGDSVTGASQRDSTVLFTVAENLSEMQIEAVISELDVASIYRGQRVSFTSESHPGRDFFGVVDNIRLVPLIINNVVSYTVIIKTGNEDLSLLPGMSCVVEFVVERSIDTLYIANAALRYTPSKLDENIIEDIKFLADIRLMDEYEREEAIRERSSQGTRGSNRRNSNTGLMGLIRSIERNINTLTVQRGANALDGVRYLWFINGSGSMEAVKVELGIVTGSYTEIFFPDDLENKAFIARERN